jgi:ribosome-binding protein aMBF1 (putative translation factor)
LIGSRLKPHPIPDAALDADIAILGKKGRGKTFTAKGLVERLLQMQRRVLVLDPLSVWWGLKSAADGKSPGFPIPVFGGPHADIPLHDAAGPIIAELIVSTGTSAVLDMGQMRKAEQARLVADLLDYLFTRNRDALWLVLEEADAFAPQQPMGDLTRVLGEVDRIARRGRNFGFRLISITQRPAKLNKDVLTQLSTLIAMGVTSPQDRDAVKAWVDGNADRDQARKVYDSLARLPVGEGWIWAPDHDLLDRVKFPAIRTLDTSKTPQARDIRITAPVLASADLAKITKQIQAIQATQDGKAKRPAKAAAAKTSLVPVQPKPASPPKVVSATAPSQLGAAILAARTAAGLSQTELAAKLKTAQANIARLEKVGSIPSTSTLQRVAKATGHKLIITFTRDA